ncbi:MAG: protein translocase subunit SecD, partial [Pelagibacteraceae bacterium]|nr:protein translocase subunit SecD [Pelagibacteraceae bacterium]
MLYFSKLKVIFIYVLIIFLSYFSISNFLSQNYKLFDKKINLGLDLQGGSYLLLEVDSSPIVLQKLQKKFSDLKKFFREQNIKFKNIKIENNKIYFEIDENSKDKFVSAFTNKNDNSINNYFNKYKAFEF